MSLPSGATNARRVGGGDINEAWRVWLADGREAFVKTRSDVGPDEYAVEARGLRWLAEPGALRTPRVLEVADDHLVLEWVPQGSLSSEGAEELGRGLALTHAAGAPAFGAPPFFFVRTPLPVLLPPSTPKRAARATRRPRPSARCGSPTTPPPTGRPSTPSGACSRSHVSRASVAFSRSGGRTRSRRCASACPKLGGPAGAAGAAARGSVERQRDGRRRRPPVADRPLRLRRPSRGGSRDAARCSAGRRDRNGASSRPTRRSRRSPRAGRSAWSCGSCCRCSCTPCCSVAAT